MSNEPYKKDEDELYDAALALVKKWRDGRQARLARELKIGVARAGYLINMMQANRDIPPEWDHVWQSNALKKERIKYEIEELVYRIARLFRK